MSELPVCSKADEMEIEALFAAKTRSRRQRLRDELRTRPAGYSTLADCLLLGPVLAPLLFPQAPLRPQRSAGWRLESTLRYARLHRNSCSR